jgi:hypothetical protein
MRGGWKLFTSCALAACLFGSPSFAAQVPVRYAEGVTHGFLVLRTLANGYLARGDLLQTVRGNEVESRLLFRFKDGSLFDETIVFEQDRVFTMRSHRLVHKGPAFPEDLEASLDRPGRWRISVRSHDDGVVDIDDGDMDLPADTYDGVMILMLLKNLSKGAGETIHTVSFSPKPRLIELELAPDGDEQVRVGGASTDTTRFLLKPRLGPLLKVFAGLTGKTPPDFRAWIFMDKVPTFGRFEGQLYTGGPVWRIDLASPTWPD